MDTDIVVLFVVFFRIIRVGLKSDGTTGHLAANYRAIILSAVDRFNDNNSVLVQFTLPAVDSLIHS